MISDTVIREITKDVWTFSKPFARFGVVPIGGRSTAVRLRNGDLWVLASTPLNDETKAKLDELGPVKYIIGPDAVHSLFVGDFKKAYPSAKVIGVETHIDSPGPHLSDVKFDGAYGKDPVGTKYGFEDEVNACYFSGFINKDVAFNHIESKSLIVADLLFNLPANEQYSKSTTSTSWPISMVSGVFGMFGFGNLSPYSWGHKRFVWSAGKDKDAMRRDVATVDSWDFTRIIPCHGDVIENDAKKAWREAYKWYLPTPSV